jgi:putative transcriptional regulator
MQSLRHHFLLAMPSLAEGFFAHSVTYLCDHGPDGAMGIVINHPLDLTLGEIFSHLELEDSGRHSREPVLAGGPVQTERGFVLHSPTVEQWEATLPLTEELALTTSRDILEALAQDRGPQRALVALGYAGWGPGQLEEELAANAWLTLPADIGLIFDTPFDERLQVAAARLGIDLNLMAPGAGHA